MLAKRVVGRATRDATAPFFETFLAIDELATDQLDAFRERMAALQAPLVAFVEGPRVDQPMVTYANAVRVERPMLEADFSYNYAAEGRVRVIGGGAVGLAFNLPGMIEGASQGATRPPDWRIVHLVQTIVHHCARAFTILARFEEMMRLERGHAHAKLLYKEMARTRIYPMLEPRWKKLVAERVGFWARMKVQLSE